MFQARDELYSKQQKVKQKCLKFRQKEYHFSAIGAKNIQKFIGFQWKLLQASSNYWYLDGKTVL